MAETKFAACDEGCHYHVSKFNNLKGDGCIRCIRHGAILDWCHCEACRQFARGGMSIEEHRKLRKKLDKEDAEKTGGYRNGIYGRY